MLLVDGFRDTQCGFKLYRGHVAKQVFSLQELDNYVFDVEVLLISQDLGYQTREVPVTWRHAEHSKVSPVFDAADMLKELVKLKIKRTFS
jgi:dolichyl-phosphate beta-glucosyltransferase